LCSHFGRPKGKIVEMGKNGRLDPVRGCHQGGRLRRAGGGGGGISLGGGGGRGFCFWRTPASTWGRRRTIWTSPRDSGGWQITSSWTHSGPPFALTRPWRGLPCTSS
jgi:hypothetical protein